MELKLVLVVFVDFCGVISCWDYSDKKKYTGTDTALFCLMFTFHNIVYIFDVLFTFCLIVHTIFALDVDITAPCSHSSLRFTFI